MEERLKKGLLVFMLIILLLPYLQHRFNVIDSGVLYGYFSDAPDVDFSFTKYFDGSYQAGISDFYNDHIGFRPDFLRLNAQIDYSLFQKLDYGGTTLGNDHYLFYDNYIDAYYGRDFVGYNLLYERMLKVKALQDTLARSGKTLILVYAPCKAWFYAEYIPAIMKYPKGEQNNYKTFARIGDSLGIDQIDFNKWFLSKKDTVKELLYSRLGIHWTNYGAILAGDSLIKFIERKRNIRMLHPVWTRSVRTTEARMPDNDMVTILNLIFPVAKDTFCYPELQFNGDTAGTTKPKMIFIGDSYVINLLGMNIVQHAAADWQFWFSFKNILNDTNWCTSSTYPQIVNYDWKKEIGKSDCIIIMNTAKNASLMGSGFIEQAYDYYFPHK